MKTPDLTTLLVFKNIYQTKNLSQVAEMMNLSKPAISKRLDQLEEELGFKLFHRTTRSVVATAEARNLIIKVNEIFDKVESLNTSLTASKSHQKRTIRISCIASMAQKFMGKVLVEYQKKHPNIEFNLIVTDSVLDPIEHNIDLMIRTNPDKKSSLVGRKIGGYSLVWVATPSYLKKYKKIKEMEDLLDHDLLIIDKHLSVLNHVKKELKIQILQKRSFVTNDSPLMSQLVKAGHGVGVRSSWDVKEDVQKKRLQLVNPGLKLNESNGEVWLLSSNDRLQDSQVRDLFNYLVESIAPFFKSL